MRLVSDGRESRNEQSTNHVCSPEVSKTFVGELVYAFFPYFNLTENGCCFDLSNETLMLISSNFTLPGSSVVDCPSRVGVNFGREQNRKRASQT